MSRIQAESTQHTKNQKNVTKILEKRQPIDPNYKMNQMLELKSDEDFKTGTVFSQK